MKENFKHDIEGQDFYDAFNKFIFSKDKKVLAKLISKFQFLDRVRDIPGDVVELGVFKGSGLVSWLKINQLTSVNSRKVYGFDIFDNDSLLEEIKDGEQRKLMKSLFLDRNFKHTDDYQVYLDELTRSIGFDNFSLIKGNVFDTIPVFLSNNPGFRAALINFDLDIDEPTYFALESFWSRLVPGGIMVFDEYGIAEWDESNAVDRFCQKHDLKLISTGFMCPSAYVVKK